MYNIVFWNRFLKKKKKDLGPDLPKLEIPTKWQPFRSNFQWFCFRMVGTIAEPLENQSSTGSIAEPSRASTFHFDRGWGPGFELFMYANLANLVLFPGH